MQKFSSIIHNEKLEELFGIIKLTNTISHVYSIGPGDNASIVTNKDGQIQQAEWGMSKGGFAILYADFQRVHVKSSFRIPFRFNRCIALADSFYAWSIKDQVPIRVYRKDGLPLFIPAIYVGEDDHVQFTIITRGARQSLSTFADKEPILMSNKEALRWLDEISVQEAITTLQTVLQVPLEHHHVSTKVLVAGFSDKILHQQVDQTPSLF